MKVLINRKRKWNQSFLQLAGLQRTWVLKLLVRMIVFILWEQSAHVQPKIHFQISRCFIYTLRWPITMSSFLSHSRMARSLLSQSYKTATIIVGLNANLPQIGIAILSRETQLKSCCYGLSWCGKTPLHLSLLTPSSSSQDKKRCDREMLLLLSSWPSLLPFGLPSCPLGFPVAHLAFPFAAGLIYPFAEARVFFTDIRTSISRILWLTKDWGFFRNFPNFLH